MSEWLPDYRYDAPRINDPFYENMIKMFRSRAVYWRRISGFLITITVAIVVVGIGIFLTGDPQREVLSGREVEIRTELTAIRDKLAQSEREKAELEQSVETLSRAERLSEFMTFAEKATLAALLGPTQSKIRDLTGVLETTSLILRTATEPLEEIVYVFDVSSRHVGDSQRFPQGAVQKLREAFADSAVGIEPVQTSIDRLLQAVRAVHIAEDGSASDIQGLKDAADAEITRIRNLSQVQETLKRQLTDVSAAISRRAGSSIMRNEEVAALQDDERRKKEELEEIVDERNKILFMSWLPDLTLRVGAVVLMLFLTQIFLATYRYTIALSSYYLARSDALQLLQPGAARDQWYDINHLKILTEGLTPGGSVDAVKAPTEHVVDLAKTWINRSPSP